MGQPQTAPQTTTSFYPRVHWTAARVFAVQILSAEALSTRHLVDVSCGHEKSNPASLRKAILASSCFEDGCDQNSNAVLCEMNLRILFFLRSVAGGLLSIQDCLQAA